MKLMMFEKGKGAALGLVEGKTVIDLGAADAVAAQGPQEPDRCGAQRARRRQVGCGQGSRLRQARARQREAGAADRADRARSSASASTTRCTPRKAATPSRPTPRSSCACRPRWCAAGAPVIRPKVSTQLDYECELTIVIGKGGRHIPEAKALEHVFGYTLFNDVSVRDFQRKTSQWTPGKNFDGTGPAGPLGRHGRRAAAGRVGAAHHDPRQRRDHAGLQHLRHDLLHRQDHRATCPSS